MSDELKPCPFCGSDDVEIALTRVWWHLWYFCECQDCGAEGHSTIYKGSAIANWNMRSGQYELRARAEAAEARVAQLERELAKRRWIPVEERLPDPFICVMATNGRVVTEAKYYYYCGKLAKHGWYQIDGMAIGSVWATHWMPLPEPPEADNG
jgi:Lar family restriction alleviation protein